MKDVRIHFDKHNLFEVALIGILIYGLWTIGDFLLVLGAGVILSAFIEDFVVRGRKFKIPRLASVIIFYLVAGLVLSLLVIFVLPVLAREIAALGQTYPEIQAFLSSNNLLPQSSEAISFSSISEQLQDPAARERIFSASINFFGGLVNILIIFVVSFYLSATQYGIDHLLRIMTPMKYEDRVVDLWHRVQRKIGSWFRGQLIIAVILTVLTYTGLALAGIPYAFLLAILAGVFGLVPYGIFLALLPAIAIALGSGGIWAGVGVAVFYLVLQV